jgi:hypothetical protein
VLEGGHARWFFENRKLPFFEEYPTRPPSFVLNGFMFALLGLYDLAAIAPGTQARSLYRAGRRTLLRALPLYDFDGVSSYDLTHVTDPSDEGPNIPPRDYQELHLVLLDALDSVGLHPALRYWRARWAENGHRAPSR